MCVLLLKGPIPGFPSASSSRHDQGGEEQKRWKKEDEHVSKDTMAAGGKPHLPTRWILPIWPWHMQREVENS